MSERAFLLEKLHELAALNVDQRLISTLTHLSTDRSFTAPDGRLKLENSHHRLLCEMVGATRESIALALNRLVSAGIAERKGMTFLIEPGSLRGNGDRNAHENGDRNSPIPVQRELSPS
jgi:CRP-like cAMP-binding protein